MFHLMLVQAIAAATITPPPFIVRPYLQLGDAPSAESETLTLLWHSDTGSSEWEVDLKPAGSTMWKPQRTFYPSRIAVPGLEPYDIYRGTLGDLAPGSKFEYRVKRNGAVVFTSTGQAR